MAGHAEAQIFASLAKKRELVEPTKMTIFAKTTRQSISSMKRFLLFLAGIMGLVSCTGPEDVPYTELERYFFKNGQDIPENPKIDSEEAFVSLFGMAPIMGESGKPTPVDFEKEFVIAVVNPVTEFHTEVKPESLLMENGELVFTYSETVGEKQSWSMQPILLVKVSRKYETETVRLDRRLQVLTK